MTDQAPLRPNVGIILSNAEGQVLWARRSANSKAWQFPQGGIQEDETPQEAMYRELHEELGIHAEDVQIMAETQGWFSYLFPLALIRKGSSPVYVGQRQKWFLLRLLSDDSKINLSLSHPAEFNAWSWVDYWHPLTEIVEFKYEVYAAVLKELERYIHRP